MKKLWFTLKIFCVAAAAFIAVVNTGWFPQIPDWTVITVALFAGVGAGLLQKWAEFEELTRDIIDLFSFAQSGQISPQQFQDKLLEISGDIKSIWSSVPFVSPPKPSLIP